MVKIYDDNTELNKKSIKGTVHDTFRHGLRSLYFETLPKHAVQETKVDQFNLLGSHLSIRKEMEQQLILACNGPKLGLEILNGELDLVDFQNQKLDNLEFHDLMEKRFNVL